MRKLVSTWILLSVVLAAGRLALWLATRTLDLRFPGLFELAVVPGVQVLVLLWVWRDFEFWAALKALPRAARRPPWSTALLCASLAAVVSVSWRALGGTLEELARAAELAVGVLALLAVIACARGQRDALDTPARLDWWMAAAFLFLFASNAIYPWLELLTISALPKGGGEAPAVGLLTLVAIPSAVALVLRLEGRLASPEARQLLWLALGLGVFSVQLGFLLWWRAGTAPEPWPTLRATAIVATFATLLVSLRASTGLPNRDLDPPARQPLPIQTLVNWIALALAHFGVAAVMRLVLFPRWQPDLRTVLSITLVTALQALALRLLNRGWHSPTATR